MVATLIPGGMVGGLLYRVTGRRKGKWTKKKRLNTRTVIRSLKPS